MITIMMNKINKIMKKFEQFIEKEYGEELNYEPVKTKSEFLMNYEKHDLANNYIVNILRKNNYTILPLAKDLRYSKIIMKNELPDFLAIKEEKIWAFDLKSKGKLDYFGWVNKRAIDSYNKFKEEIGIQIYLIFVLIQKNQPTGKIGYTSLDMKPKNEKVAWDKNIVLIYEWLEGLPISEI